MTEYTITISGYESGLTKEGIEQMANTMIDQDVDVIVEEE